MLNLPHPWKREPVQLGGNPVLDVITDGRLAKVTLLLDRIREENLGINLTGQWITETHVDKVIPVAKKICPDGICKESTPPSDLSFAKLVLTGVTEELFRTMYCVIPYRSEKALWVLIDAAIKQANLIESV